MKRLNILFDLFLFILYIVFMFFLLHKIVSQGCKIHATVRRHLIPLFKAVIIEGEVYTLSAFSVVDAYGLCRPTRHPCRLFFHSTTILEKMVCRAIKMNGLSLVDIGQINSHSCDSNYLVGKFYMFFEFRYLFSTLIFY